MKKDTGFMNGIKKIFVESDEVAGSDIDMPNLPPLPQTPAEPVIDESIETSHEGVVAVESIYEQDTALLADPKHDIHVIEKMVNALPATLDMATVKSTLVALLGVNGLDVAKLLEDKNMRAEMLAKYKAKDTAESDGMITEATDKIAELETEIEDLKKLISNEQKRKITQDEVLKVENEKLDKLAAYLS